MQRRCGNGDQRGLTVELPEQLRESGYERGRRLSAPSSSRAAPSSYFAEGLLDLSERLLDALTTGANRPDLEEMEYLRAGLSRWREQVAALR